MPDSHYEGTKLADSMWASKQKFGMFFAGLIFAILSFLAAHPIGSNSIFFRLLETTSMISLLVAGIKLLMALEGVKWRVKFIKNNKQLNDIVYTLTYWHYFLIGMITMVISRSLFLLFR